MKTSANIKPGLIVVSLVILTLFLFSTNSVFANTRESPVRLNHTISSEQLKHANDLMLAKGQWQYRSVGKSEKSSDC